MILSAVAALVGILASAFLEGIRKAWYQRSSGANVASILGLGIPTLIFMGILTAMNAASGDLGWMETAALVLSGGLCLAIAPSVHRRTAYGAALTGRVLGFRNFLMAAERDRLRVLLKDSPDYFYDILPYAQVLGVTDQWARRFEGLTLPPPSW